MRAHLGSIWFARQSILRLSVVAGLHVSLLFVESREALDELIDDDLSAQLHARCQVVGFDGEFALGNREALDLLPAIQFQIQCVDDPAISSRVFSSCAISAKDFPARPCLAAQSVIASLSRPISATQYGLASPETRSSLT